MRLLTFKGFLKSYVYELSDCKSYSLMKLARESSSKNPRLREPLLLYALLTYDKATALRLLRSDSALVSDYSQFFAKYKTTEELLNALNQASSDVPLSYLKVFKSYLSVKNRCANDSHTKSLMRTKMLQLQQQKGVSAYRVYTALKLNPGNYHAFMKKNQLDKLSLENTRGAYEYLRNR